MVNVPLGQTDWDRGYSRAPYLRLRNRFPEANPANGVEGTSLLMRPALKRWLNVGDGPNRGLFSEAGSFDGDLFVMSGRVLYRVSITGGQTQIGNSFFLDGDTKTRASMAATASIGTDPERLFIADGKQLKVYSPDIFARGELLVSGGNIANNDVVELGGVYYRFTNGSVDSGTPAGTVGNPWLVAHASADNRENLLRLSQAINATGTAGTTYSTALVENASAEVTGVTATNMLVVAKAVGPVGNTITSTETGTHLSWGAATLTGGADAGLSIVDLPDGQGAISVAFIAGYIIVVPTSVKGTIGRFYWIEPGATTIDPLNFATAERSPDPLVAVRSLGDQFALFGLTTTEMWFPTGDADAPFQRSQGRVFDRGVWVGSDAAIKDTLVIMDTDGVVYRIDGGGPQRISDNSVEQRTREAIKTATSPATPPTESTPGPLTVTLSSTLVETSARSTSTVFPSVLADISGGVGPYQVRFFWGTQSNGTFGFLGSNTQVLVSPQVSAVANSDTAAGVLFCTVTDAQGTVATSAGATYRFTNTLLPGEVITPPPAFSVTANVLEQSLSGSQSSALFGTFSAIITGGTGPFTYQWFFNFSDLGSFSILSPTASGTNVSVSGVGTFGTARAGIQCRVTDSLGAVATTPQILLTYARNSTNSEIP